MLSSIDFTEEGIKNSFNEEQLLKNPSPNSNSDGGSVTCESEEQPLKILSLIVVIVEGTQVDLSEEHSGFIICSSGTHPLNDKSPIVVMELGILIIWSDEHPLKRFLPIEIGDKMIIIDFKDEHHEEAEFAIDLTEESTITEPIWTSFWNSSVKSNKEAFIYILDSCI